MFKRASVRRSWQVFCAIAIALVVTLMAAAQSVPSPSTITSGKIGPGSLYEIAMPALVPWNGELVVYAHGIVDPTLPVRLPAIEPLRDFLTSQGFAVVYSSYSQNGFAVKDGVQRTHQLRGIFASRMGQPARTYLFGHSLGALIALELAERYPDQYDGAMPACGLIGGSPAELAYIGDARVLFDYFFPGVAPGMPFNSPPNANLGPVIQALSTGFGAPDFKTVQFANAAKLPASGPSEIVTAGATVIGFGVVFGNNLIALTNGHVPYDNTETVYSGSFNDTALNAGVARFEGGPAGLNYLARYYTPTGLLRVPVVTVHTTRDPVVPFFHEQMYAKTVQDAGASQFLLQRSVDSFGHCTFAKGEDIQAFLALVQWVHTGQKPPF
ncbi:MAG: hypothetical protein ACM3NQ_15890 [Bacteroidales bacterium]